MIIGREVSEDIDYQQDIYGICTSIYFFIYIFQKYTFKKQLSSLQKIGNVQLFPLLSLHAFVETVVLTFFFSCYA